MPSTLLGIYNYNRLSESLLIVARNAEVFALQFLPCTWEKTFSHVPWLCISVWKINSGSRKSALCTNCDSVAAIFVGQLCIRTQTTDALQTSEIWQRVRAHAVKVNIIINKKKIVLITFSHSWHFRFLIKILIDGFLKFTDIKDETEFGSNSSLLFKDVLIK